MIEQPPGTSLCGQVAVANLVGCTLDEAIKAVGHSKSTRTLALAKALRSLGCTCADKLDPLAPRPRFGIAKQARPGRAKNRGWHWVAIVNYEVVDGWDWGPLGHPEGTRITSYLEVELPA